MSEVLDRPITETKVDQCNDNQSADDQTLVYECPDCGYHYEEALGCEREGYPPGTKWADIPDDFPCPDCFVREKPDFLALNKQ